MKQAGHETVDQSMKNPGNLLVVVCGSWDGMSLPLGESGSCLPEVGDGGFFKTILSKAIYKNIFLR